MDTQAPSLKQIQHWLKWIITDPRGVTHALKHCNPGKEVLKGTVPERCHVRFVAPEMGSFEYICADPPLSREARISVYAEAFFLRLVECVGQEFPATFAILDEEQAEYLIAKYLVEYPSQSYTVAQLGEFLAPFIAKDSISKQFPFLSELALLEWHIVNSFYADTQPTFDLAVLQTIAPEQWPQVKFTLDHSLRLGKFEYPVQELWRERENGPAKELSAKLTYLKIQRVDEWPVPSEISELEFSYLSQLQAGKALGEIEVEGATPEWTSTHFNRWLTNGTIRALQF